MKYIIDGSIRQFVPQILSQVWGEVRGERSVERWLSHGS